MAEVKWIKLTVDMFDDEKIKIIQSMPEGDALLIVWIKLLTLAGKTNDGGYIYIADGMPYTDEMLSVIINKPLNTIRLALDTFLKLGMIENDVKGIYLLNFDKHQSLDRLAIIREQTRKRVAKHREKLKELPSGNECNVTCNVCNDTDIDIEEDIDIDKNNIKNEKVKHKYGEYQNVFFTDEQYEKLKIEFPNDYNNRIEKLDLYIQSTGKKYKDCLATIRNWARNEKGKGKIGNGSNKKSIGSEFAEFI